MQQHQNFKPRSILTGKKITFFMYWKAIKGYHSYLVKDLNFKKHHIN